MTRSKEHIFTTTTRAQSSDPSLTSPGAVVVVGGGIPKELERLIDTLLISDRRKREEIASAHSQDPDRVMTWALVLASRDFCEDCGIRSPSGFFLSMLERGTKAPTLISPQSEGACQYCGDTGRIEIKDIPKRPRELTIYSCPGCGKTPEESCAFGEVYREEEA